MTAEPVPPRTDPAEAAAEFLAKLRTMSDDDRRKAVYLVTNAVCPSCGNFTDEGPCYCLE